MLCYEISKESFKQRLEERGNFFLIEVSSPDHSLEKASFKEVHLLNDLQGLSQRLDQLAVTKGANLLFFSLVAGHQGPKKAAQAAADLGYHFCYFYQGIPNDHLLDQGLN